MPDPPREFKVIDIRRLPATDPKRMGRWDKVVIYELDDAQRHTVLVPEENLTDQVVIAAVRSDIKERGAWLGRSFQL